MTATKWDGGVIPSTAVNADNSLLTQEFVINLDMQTLITITAFAYALGTNSLEVYLNGSIQRINTDYVEVSPTSFNFTTPLEAGDIVYVIGVVGGVFTQNAQTSAAQAAASAIAAANYLAAIQALTPPSLPLSIANGGTGQVAKAAAFNALSPLTTAGDILLFSAGNNIRLPTAADGSILVTEAAATGGQKYYPAKPMKLREGISVPITLTAADAGELVVATNTVTNVTIDLAANLFPGWTVYISCNDVRAGVTGNGVNITLSGTDVFRTTGNNTFVLPIGATVGIQCAPGAPGWFTIFTATASLFYLKVRDQKATNVSNGAAILGLNDRPFGTVVENGLGYDPFGFNPAYIQLLKGTWRYRITTVHTGTASTKLALYQLGSGGTLIATGKSNPPNSLVNEMSGRFTLGATGFVYVREYFNAAGGTLGSAVVDGNPEVYSEAEFWRE